MCTEGYTKGQDVHLSENCTLPLYWAGDTDCFDGIVTMNSDKTCSVDCFGLNTIL